MGVDITHIIKHDFHDVKNRKASEAFARRTIDKLKSEFRMDNYSIELYTEEYDDSFYYTFNLPIYDVEFILRDGFWEINSFFHYCQIVMHEGTHFWLRELTFDLARALGQDEAWYAEEFFTWNCPHFDIETGSFEEWLSFANSRFNGHIPEFDVDTIMQQGDVHIPDYEVIYHDSFKECRKLFKDIQQKLGDDAKLLGVSRIGNAYRCLRNGNVVLVTIDSLKPLLDFPFDKATCDLNGPEIVVFKDGLSAVFDPEGKQLTEFVSGTFKWHFSWSNDVLKREIYNSEAGISIIV